ncbi:peptidoglycan hydrolase-like protein with peptidoglycan-binding domain [Nocardiopsis sp. Huas11]|uniref:peptidoglycan-binding protein n=1 Tax=Nocardiopsis sp. Huas11 TaxID=2183912 RepID=UPI000EB33C40|nr:peptidoglycan-binding protein [Nocardiopsis sp. Huas11]RKS06785.1 peptidoglycan hydrolase-like protein with peptidoglycan-binding domain [Nocardiopsis sp. Huas11]
MPEPDKLQWRSDFGWSPHSPASSANPRSGLVIHYDSTDQGLADKPHSACVSYWKRTRAFHTGPSRGWADIGYCVDEATEILTEDGWKNFRQIEKGVVVLTLDHETGMSQWQPIEAVNVFPAKSRELVRMEGREHSSLTTAQHRWPVERYFRRTGTQRQKSADGRWAATGRSPRTQQGHERVWATTGSLTYWDRIPLSAPCDDLPTEPKWSDALVELVAWFWTEGHIRPQSRSRLPSTAAAIYQSHAKNPKHVARIRSALHVLIGPPCESFPRSGSQSDGLPRWKEARNRQLTEFHLSVDAGRLMLEQAPDRVPTYAFMRSLTRAQLELFIAVSLMADGHNNRTVNAQALSQKSREAAEAFQFAVTLAGHATSLRRRPPNASTKYDMWKVELRRKTHFSPRAAAARKSVFRVSRESYAGHIWCPTTPNGTWLARREGTVYFTGNSFMCCAHGYVMEGRGLFRTQAAQPGGNSTYYSCSLATGPKDPITAAQVNAVRQLRAWLMEPQSSIAGTVKGHRDFVSTSCPGQKAYDMVRDGTFRKAAKWGDDAPDEDERPAPAPDPPRPPGPGTEAPPFPLPSGHAFGPRSGPDWQVSGYYSHREDLRRWQRRMRDRGWVITPDGLYGDQTEAVTRAFQREKQLGVDGLIGARTWAAAWTATIT